MHEINHLTTTDILTSIINLGIVMIDTLKQNPYAVNTFSYFSTNIFFAQDYLLNVLIPMAKDTQIANPKS